MKKALMVTLAVVMAFGLLALKCGGVGGKDYFPVGVGYTWTSQTTTVVYDSTYDYMTEEWVVTHDTTVTETTTECIGEAELDDGTAVWEFMSTADTVVTYSYRAFNDDNEVVDFYTDKADTAPYYSIPYALDMWTMPFGVEDKVITYEADGTEDVTIGEDVYTGAAKIKVTYPEIEGMTYVGANQWWDVDAGVIKYWHATEVSVEDVMYILTDVVTVLTDFVME